MESLLRLVGRGGREEWEARFRQIAMEGGFEVTECRAEHSEVDSFRDESGAPVLLHRVTFDGRLAVTDAEKAEMALREGLGPVKRWGCGLMTIDRLDTPYRA